MCHFIKGIFQLQVHMQDRHSVSGCHWHTDCIEKHLILDNNQQKRCLSDSLLYVLYPRCKGIQEKELESNLQLKH